MSTTKPDSKSLFVLTPRGVVLAEKIRRFLTLDTYCTDECRMSGYRMIHTSFAETFIERFRQDKAMIVIGSTGQVVRALAKCFLEKYDDPAVVVIDEKGEYVVSLLAGQSGGADALAQYLAGMLGAQAVITSIATHQKPTYDSLAHEMNAWIDHTSDASRTINKMLLAGEKVGLYLDPDLAKYDTLMLTHYDVRGFTLLDHLSAKPRDLAAMIYVTYHEEIPEWPLPLFRMIPRRIVIGLQLQVETSFDCLNSIVTCRLQSLNIDPRSVTVIGSIDKNATHQALHDLVEQFHASLQLFTEHELASCLLHFSSPALSVDTIGLDAVSQPVTWLLSQGHLIGEAMTEQGVTVTVGVYH